MKNIAYSILLLINILIVSAANAEVRGYGLVDIGFNQFDLDDFTSDSDVDDDDKGFTLGAGVNLNDHVALELAYNDYGSIDFTTFAVIGGLGLVFVENTLSATSWSFTGNFGGKLTKIIKGYLIAGVDRGKAELTVNGSEVTSNSETDFIFGVGADFDLSYNNLTNARLRLESHSEGDIIRLSIGFSVGS